MYFPGVYHLVTCNTASAHEHIKVVVLGDSIHFEYVYLELPVWQIYQRNSPIDNAKLIEQRIQLHSYTYYLYLYNFYH